MEKSRRNKLMLRWSLLTTFIIALCWFIYWLIVGEVPNTRPHFYSLISISHWWDILSGPIWSILVILFFSDFPAWEKAEERIIITNLKSGATKGAFMGLLLGLVMGVFFGLLLVLMEGMIYGLLFMIATIIIMSFAGLLIGSALGSFRSSGSICKKIADFLLAK